jgi:type II secretory pathway component PulK
VARRQCAARLRAAADARTTRRQGGVALAIVVWFIAGMSLLVAGIVGLARVDTQLAQLQVARAKAAAAGDGAIALMMVDVMTGERGAGELPVGRYRLGGLDIQVVLVPSSGLIDVNSAPVDMLAALFELAGRQDEDGARQLAETVVAARTAGGGGETQDAVKLVAIEDLLRVPGFSRTLLDSVRDFIVVARPGQGGMNWSQAPESVLAVLAKASPTQAEMARARRNNKADGMAGAYRADALVRYGDKIWLRRRWLSFETSPSTNLPWHATRTEPPRVLVNNEYQTGSSVDA